MGCGLLEDALRRGGLTEADAVRTAMGLVGLGVVAAFLWLFRGDHQGADNHP